MKKDWLARELTMEVLVGVFLVMVLLGLGFFTIVLSGEQFGKKQYKFEAVFDDVMGLRVNDDVVVRGMPIGSVTALDLQEDGVHVYAALDSRVFMRKDYRVTIVNKSMLGGRYLQIYEGSEKYPELPKDYLVKGEKPYDLMTDAAELVGALKDGFTKGGIIENLQNTSEKIDELTTRLTEGKGTLGKLMSEDDQLYKDLASSVGSLKKIAQRLESGEGTLGRLMSEDDSLYVEMEQIIKEARAAVDDFRETSPVVTFTSVFFGAL